MQDQNPPNLIIYNIADGKASMSLLAKDGQVWMMPGEKHWKPPTLTKKIWRSWRSR